MALIWLTGESTALPPGSTFISVEVFGTSAWTITGRILAREADGSEKPYFVKVGHPTRHP
jgi:hypothetical protein